jgi:hypothetical protein
MSGKFINTSYVNSIDNLTKGTINKVKNANYVYNDKSPVISDWYNLNNRGTTFDEGTRAEYVSIGYQSPFKFNKIIDAVFYASGIKIEFDVEYDENGLGITNPPNIGGIVLPNTWIPYANDYFVIKHADKNWLYRVTAVSFDTLDNGNNVYKFEATCEQHGLEDIEKQVVERYRMIINNVGTNFNAVIKEENYNSIVTIDTIVQTLRNNFIALFYNDKVQTFTYTGYYGNLYDPYMIEFLMRNKILDGSEEYIYVHHEVPVPRDFDIEYMNTFFRGLEMKNINLFTNTPCVATLIEDQYSLFASVLEEYFMVSTTKNGIQKFQVLDAMLVSLIKENAHAEEYDNKAYYNIIINYMNGRDIGSEIVSELENIKFEPTPSLFYALPMIIFILENSVEKLLK